MHARSNLFALLALLLLSGAAHALDSSQQVADSTKPRPPRSKPMLVFKFGGFTGGKVTVEEIDTVYSVKNSHQVDPGTSIGVCFEFSSPVWTTAGLSLDLHRINPAEGLESKWMLDIGVVIKSAMRRPKQSWAIRPLIGISYGYIPSLESITQSASFMVVKVGGELVLFPKRGRIGLAIETCLIASPFGRSFSADNRYRYDISAKPRPIIRAGIALR